MLKNTTIEKTLREKVADETQFGSVVRDFETFLKFIAENDLDASGTNQLLPLKSLRELNALVSKPFDINLKRPVQKSFANLNGLFMLGRAGGLLILRKSAKGAKLAVDAEALKIWRTLNLVERYFTLVETFLTRVSLELVGEHQSLFDSPLYRLSKLLKAVPEKGLDADEDKFFKDSGLIYYGSHNLALAEMFGWLELVHGQSETKGGWKIKTLKYTDFGRAVISLLQESYTAFDYDWKNVINEADFDENAFNLLQPVLHPYFPQWQNIFRLPPTESANGIFVFKVSLGKKTWRRIAVSSNDVLDDLHDAIQNAFEFDNDHLYEFSFRTRFGTKQRVVHPICEEEFSTDEFQIKDLPLKIGETMEYIFDFGDYWQFTIELEEIQPPNPQFRNAQILESHGKSPEQYPEWEDDDY